VLTDANCAVTSCGACAYGLYPEIDLKRRDRRNRSLVEIARFVALSWDRDATGAIASIIPGLEAIMNNGAETRQNHAGAEAGDGIHAQEGAVSPSDATID